jgi:hypothetical protein
VRLYAHSPYLGQLQETSIHHINTYVYKITKKLEHGERAPALELFYNKMQQRRWKGSAIDSGYPQNHQGILAINAKRICPASWETKFTLWIRPVNKDPSSIWVILRKKATCRKNKSKKMNVGVATDFQGWFKPAKRLRVLFVRILSSLLILFPSLFLFCRSR